MKRYSPQKKISMTRRQLLQCACTGSGLAMLKNPIEMMLGSLVDGIITKAQADENSSPLPKNYIFLYLQGGKPRWYFDLVMKQNASTMVNPNCMVNTAFDPNTGLPTYKTVTSPSGPNGTYELPSLWASQIPTSSGGWVPMTNILSGMLSIRGINMEADGHSNNAQKQIQPAAGGPSLDGLVADGSNAYVPAIGDANFWTHSAYLSQKGIGQQSFSGQSYGLAAPNTNPFQSILGSFYRGTSNTDGLPSAYLTRREAMDQLVNAGLAKLATYASKSNPGSTTLYSMRSQAQQLLTQGIGDLSASFTSLNTKYQTLISACANGPRIGLTDNVINSSTFSGMNQWTTASTLGAILQADQNTNTDLRNIIRASSTINNMASSFAIAEYMITQGYSSAASLGIDYGSGLNFSGFLNGSAAVDPTNFSNGLWQPDEHETGSVTSLIVNSFYYQSLAACLNELINTYKAHNVWNNTVIHVASEFSRTPNDNGSPSTSTAGNGNGYGSGHGVAANVTTLFSGAVQGPLVLGNIMTSPSAGTQGDWGVAGTIPQFDGGVQLMIGHSASTISAILGVSSPTPNNSSVVAVSNSGDTVTPLIGMEYVTS